MIMTVLGSNINNSDIFDFNRLLHPYLQLPAPVFNLTVPNHDYIIACRNDV